MKTDLLKQFRFISRKKTVNLERKLITFVIFLFITAIIWLFNVLRKEYTTDFIVPISVVNLSKELVPVTDEKRNVLVKIRSSGFGLLHFFYTHNNYQVQLDAEQLLNEKSISGNKVRLGESSWFFIEHFKRSFGHEVTILSVLPDSFIVEYAAAHTRMIPVKHDIKYRIPSQYVQIKKPVVMPDSVMVTGPKAILDTLKSCFTVKYDAGDIQSDTSIMLNVDLPGNFRSFPDKVKVTFFVDRYSEKSFAVKPVLLNVPDTAELIILPEVVSVRLTVALGSFASVQEHDIAVFADFSKSSARNSTIPLELGTLPEGAFNPVIYPPQVEFLIKKK